MSVKFICEQFALTPNCSCDLMFPWQQDFDSLVFRKLFFGKKKCISVMFKCFETHFNLDFFIGFDYFESI